MSIVEFSGGPVNYRYLMNKSKSELARLYLDLLGIRERKLSTLQATIKRLEGENKSAVNVLVALNDLFRDCDHNKKHGDELLEPHYEWWMHRITSLLNTIRERGEG